MNDQQFLSLSTGQAPSFATIQVARHFAPKEYIGDPRNVPVASDVTSWLACAVCCVGRTEGTHSDVFMAGFAALGDHQMALAFWQELLNISPAARESIRAQAKDVRGTARLNEPMQRPEGTWEWSGDDGI